MPLNDWRDTQKNNLRHHVFQSDVNFIDNWINFCNFQMNNERARFQTNFHRRPQPHKHKYTSHDDVIRWKHLPRYWPFVWGIHRSQRTVMRSFDVSLICVRIPGWLDNHDAGDLRRHCAHYDVIVIIFHVQLRDREQTTHNKLETKETNTQINSTLSRRHSNDYKVRYVFFTNFHWFPWFHVTFSDGFIQNDRRDCVKSRGTSSVNLVTSLWNYSWVNIQ